MNTDERNKIVERVKALLAMGNDVSSPNEASIALKRARALMDKHQIGMSDVESWDSDDSFGEASVDSGTATKKWYEWLIAKVSMLNDCTVRKRRRIDANTGKEIIYYLFQGFAEDVKLSEFMASYLHEACLNLYKRDKKQMQISGNRGRNSYLMGISEGICGRIDEMIEQRQAQSQVLSTGTSLVLAKAKAVTERFGKTAYSDDKSVSAVHQNAYEAGRKASSEVHLGSFVTSANSTVEKIS